MGRVALGITLSLLTSAALALRLWQIDFGLPEWLHPDEPIKAEKALAIAGGDLNPHYFWHPSFLLYATAAAVRTAQAWGWAVDTADAILAGRIVNAALGALTVPLTFLLGRATAGTAVGLGAAALLTVAPLHVFCSHYLKEDVALTFWLMAASLAAIRIAQSGGTGAYAACGALCGAAIASKYTGMLALALPYLAHGERQHRERRQLAVLTGAAAAGFVALTPFSVLDAWSFVQGVAHEGGYAVAGKTTVAIAPVDYFWTFHLRYSIAPGLGWTGTLSALAGLAAALRQPTAVHRMITAFVVLGYSIFENSPYKPPPNFDRYVLPLLPFLAVLAMIGLQAQRRRSEVLAGILLLLVLGEPATRSMRLLASVEPDTRERARSWILAELPARARIVAEGKLLSDLGDPVLAYAPQLRDRDVTYVFSLAQVRESLEQFDYAIASSFLYDRYVRFGAGDPGTRSFYAELLGREPVVVFSAPVVSYGFHNPTIRIYRLAGATGRR
jgi:4-amino-4-deoxy-L-arabinose transferase-like glycosyltransferase